MGANDGAGVDSFIKTYMENPAKHPRKKIKGYLSRQKIIP